jgi:hypothetical protein
MPVPADVSVATRWGPVRLAAGITRGEDIMATASADVLSLGQHGMTCDTLTDSGTFHVFDDEDRIRYVTSLASVLRSGGCCYLICFSDRAPGDRGSHPRRVSEDELRAAFRDGWAIAGIEADTFEVNPGIGMSTLAVPAWLATILRT